jgi:hypothetical protein
MKLVCETNADTPWIAAKNSPEPHRPRKVSWAQKFAEKKRMQLEDQDPGLRTLPTWEEWGRSRPTSQSDTEKARQKFKRQQSARLRDF